MDASHIRRFAVVLGLATVLGLLAPTTSAAAVADDDPGGEAQLASFLLTFRVFDTVFNTLDADAAEKLIAPDAVIRIGNETFTGPQGLIEYVSSVRDVYPDASFEVTNGTIQGDTLEISWQMTASQILRPGGLWDFDIALEGVTTVVVDSSQILSMSQENAVVTGDQAQDTAVVPQRGMNY